MLFCESYSNGFHFIIFYQGIKIILVKLISETRRFYAAGTNNNTPKNQSFYPEKIKCKFFQNFILWFFRKVLF